VEFFSKKTVTDIVLIIDRNKMRFLLFLFSIAIAVACTEKQPELSFQNTTVNFGQAKVGEDILAVFRFSNNSEDTVLIYDMTYDCNCLSFDTKTYPYAVPPGMTDSLVVRIDGTVENSGFKRKNIGIRTNALPSIQMLKIEGDIL